MPFDTPLVDGPTVLAVGVEAVGFRRLSHDAFVIS